MSRGWLGRRQNAGAGARTAAPASAAAPAAAAPAAAVGRGPGTGRAAGGAGSAGTAAERTQARRMGSTDVAGLAPGPGPGLVLTIDALGRKCPIPIIMLAEQIRDVPVGQIVAVLADDPAAYTDIPAWCGLKSHEFVVTRDLPRGWAFHIRRRY